MPESLLSGPLSPELVLVSPREVAELAREQLPDIAPPAAARVSRRLFVALELIAVYLICLLVTAGPLALALLTRQSAALAH